MEDLGEGRGVYVGQGHTKFRGKSGTFGEWIQEIEWLGHHVRLCILGSVQKHRVRVDVSPANTLLTKPFTLT